jgi:hypothetical protein
LILVPDADDLRPVTFPEEVSRDLWGQYRKLALRYLLAFAILFGFACVAVRWSGSVVRFAAARTGGRAVPAWTVFGVVRNSLTHAPVPWAVVADDPAGPFPHLRADADLHGAFELLTFSEPHRLRITAPGYRPATIPIGRAWFLWRLRGREQRDLELSPEP